jgi:hypothetical protein
MTRNTELLQETMQYIKDHPQQHDQSVWMNECGTAGCFLGWAAILSGKPLDWIKYNIGYAAGAKLLGLTRVEANILFASGNTRPMLELMVKDLVNGDELRDTQDYLDEAYK